MNNQFSVKIAPYVKDEFRLAEISLAKNEPSQAFTHLENAHVLGQESTYWHVKAHFLMFLWAIKQRQPKEFFGQILRMFGALTKTAVGLVPAGNTGGSNISPFKTLPLKEEHQTAITNAKSTGQ